MNKVRLDARRFRFTESDMVVRSADRPRARSPREQYLPGIGFFEER